MNGRVWNKTSIGSGTGLLGLILVLACLTGCGRDESTAPPSQEPLDARTIWERIPEVDAQTEPLATSAGRIFQRVLLTYPRLSDPKLRISEVDPDPLAWATPDGWIVLSRGALRLCYRNVSEPEGDARLAFVLSHELAHLDEDHFLHQRIWEAIRNSPGDAGQKLRLSAAVEDQDFEKEMEADRQGLIHMALAGFDPWLLLEAESDFFQQWGEQNASVLAFSHVPVGDRPGFLRGVLKGVAEKVPYFQLGVRLHQLGRYEEALALLEVFEREFQGPAVLNNLGLCHYQLAARRLASCDGELALRFKLPTVLASDTIAERFVGRGPGDVCLEDEGFKRHKRAAERYFRSSLDRQEDYLPTRINYLSLMLLSQEGTGTLARAIEISDSKRHYPELELLEVLGLYLRYHEGDLFDPTEISIQRLRELKASGPDSADVAYDLARVLLESGQAAAAEKEWRRFLDLEPHGPYADYVRQRLGMKVEDGESRPPGPAPPRPPGLMDGETRKWLTTISDPFSLRAGDVVYGFHRNSQLQALTRGDALVLVMQNLESPLSAQEIRQTYGRPLGRVATTLGEFLAYEGFGFDVEDGSARIRIFFDWGS